MDLLKLENQLCFPLYALSRQVTNVYRPLLNKLNLTYPQYLVMMLLWEHKALPFKTISERLMLDSGTLTPLLKRLEKQQLLTRKRDEGDERLVQIEITTQGEELKKQAQNVPVELARQLPLTPEEGAVLVQQLKNILSKLQQ